MNLTNAELVTELISLSFTQLVNYHEREYDLVIHITRLSRQKAMNYIIMDMDMDNLH